MESEFCIGLGKDGTLYKGLTAKALGRECPKYDHPWYADQADWIVTAIELRADPVSAKFRAAFHNLSFRNLREGLSRIAQAKTGIFAFTLTAHDGETELSIEMTPDQGALDAKFVLARRWDKLELQCVTEQYYEQVPEVVRGLDQIDASFPVIGSREKQSGIGTRQGFHKLRLPFLRLAQSLVRLPRLLRKGTATDVPMELYMEYKGQCVAKLTDPQFDDMFWTSFAFTPLTQDPTLLQMLGSSEWWQILDAAQIRYRFVDDGHIAYRTFAGAGVKHGRVSLRTYALVYSGGVNAHDLR